MAQKYRFHRYVRHCVTIAMALTVAACANGPKISIPVFETPVAYAGLGVGVSLLDVDTTDRALEQRGSTSAAVQLTLGLEMADNWALELRGADLGDAEFDNDLKLGYQVVDLTILGKLSLSTKTAMFGRVGLGTLENDGDFTVRQRNQNHVVLGAGLDIGLSPRFGVRIEAMGHDTDASHAQLSLIYRFNPRTPNAVLTDDATSGQSRTIRAPASASSISKAVVNPVKPSLTPIPTITPKPTRIERQTKPRTRKRVRPQVPALNPSPATDTNVAIAQINALSTLVLDADKDGVADAVDACSGSGEHAIVNAQGCDFYSIAAPGVVFADGSSTLDASSITALNEIVASLQKFPDIKVAIGAYSPLTGDPATDLLLSRRRTIAVIRYMRSVGVNASRTQPIAKALMVEEGGESLVNRVAIRRRK